LAPQYGADVNVVGVAALAPATEIGAMVEAAQHTVVGKIMLPFLITAYSETYPDVRIDDCVRTRARGHAMAGRCLSGPGLLLSLLTSVTLETDFFARPPTSGPLGERFKQNVPMGRMAAPVLIAQGLTDALVLASVQARFVQERCEAGQVLEYRTYQGRDHLGLIASDSPLADDLVQWTRERLAGTPPPERCWTVAR
jgi:hypothetical protein